jgi:aryl-alcohol dehydrogenase-like predicted oxidoreductase
MSTALRPIAGWQVPPIAFGGWPLASEMRPDRAQSLDTLHAAIDAGCRLFDTAIAYCANRAEEGHNEALIAEAVRTSAASGSVLIATKGGSERGPRGEWLTAGTPSDLRRQCDASLGALGVDVIDLYQLHEVDGRVPFADQIGTFVELRDAGKIRAIGLSNVSLAELDEALAITPIASVQNEFSLTDQSDRPMLDRCVAAGIAYLPYSPLGGPGAAAGLAARHPDVARIATSRGVSVQQVVLAWMLTLGDTVLPIPGARRAEHAVDSIGAAELELTTDELAAIG